MIPPWLKRFLQNHRTKLRQQHSYSRVPKTNNTSYGKVYGYEYESPWNYYKCDTSHQNTLTAPVRRAKQTHHHYYYDDHCDGGCSSCATGGAACGGDSYGGGGGDNYDGGGGDDGGCGDGGGGCGGDCGGDD